MRFLAVGNRFRSKGYGCAILQEIRKKFPDKKVIISIEPCDSCAKDVEVRKKRKEFYLRNGYKETGYRMKLNGIEQEIIVMNGVFAKKEFHMFFAVYSKGTMWPKIWRHSD